MLTHVINIIETQTTLWIKAADASKIIFIYINMLFIIIYIIIWKHISELCILYYLIYKMCNS